MRSTTMEWAVPETDSKLLASKSLRQLSEEVLERFLRDVPEPRRTEMLAQARQELGAVLSLAPLSIDAVEEVGIRASLAAGFGATYGEA